MLRSVLNPAWFTEKPLEWILEKIIFICHIQPCNTLPAVNPSLRSGAQPVYRPWDQLQLEASCLCRWQENYPDYKFFFLMFRRATGTTPHRKAQHASKLAHSPFLFSAAYRALMFRLKAGVPGQLDNHLTDPRSLTSWKQKVSLIETSTAWGELNLSPGHHLLPYASPVRRTNGLTAVMCLTSAAPCQALLCYFSANEC